MGKGILEAMSPAKYDKTSIQSILEYASRLTGKSLSDIVELPSDVVNARNRGDLGSLVERYYFEHLPPNNHEPDFAEAGLELKTTGVVRHASGGYRAKERLVLTMIRYESIVEEEWETSVFYSKCRLMLILFYLYTKEIPVHQRKFVLHPMLYQIPSNDFLVIKRDWEHIRSKVISGKAHELSEGDTFYLGACRKGSGGERESLQVQPFSSVRARTRAFAFKQSYLNALITGHSEQGSLFREDEESTLDEATLVRLRPFYGWKVSEIAQKIGLNRAPEGYKSLKADLIRRVLAGEHQRTSKEVPQVPELEKAGIEVKTITLGSNNLPREHMSFPGFKFLEIVNEDWWDSSFCEKLEKKFLLVVFRRDESGEEKLLRAGYWNMPYMDRQEARRVWEETKRRVALDVMNLPKASESHIAHVRPKAQNGKDKIPTPQGGLHVRQCFWLNREYIGEVVRNILA